MECPESKAAEPKVYFEKLMDRADLQHTSGEDATELRRFALSIARDQLGEDSLEVARAERDLAASLVANDLFEQALPFAQKSAAIFKKREIPRELAASYSILASLTQLMRLHNITLPDGVEPLDYVRLADESFLQAAMLSGQAGWRSLDPHEINMAARLAAVEALAIEQADSRRGAIVGAGCAALKACLVAPFSESPHIQQADPNRTFIERWVKVRHKAKFPGVDILPGPRVRSISRGLGACAVVALEAARRPERARQLANKLLR